MSGVKKVMMTMREGIWDKLSLNGCKYITLNVIAFILAGVQTYEMNPVGMAYFMGMAMSGYGTIGTVLIMMAGMARTYSYVGIAKYTAILLSMLVITKLIQMNKIKLSVYTYGILCMVNVLAIELVGKYMENPQVQINDTQELVKWFVLPVAMSLLSGALVVIAEKSIEILSGSQRMVTSEGMISIAVLFGCMFYGVGSTLELPYAILETVLYFMILFGAYKYGVGIGAVFGAACGIPLCLVQQNMELLGILCLTGILVGVFRNLGRMASLLTFILSIGSIGYFLIPYFASNNSVKGLLGAAIIFLAIPEEFLHLFHEAGERSMQKKMDSICQEKLLSVAKAFEKLSGSIHELSKKVPEESYEVEVDEVWRKKLEESRLAMSEQLEQISQIIQEYSKEIYDFVPISNEEESCIRHKLKGKHVNMAKIVGLENRRHKCEYLVTAKCEKGTTVGTREVAKVISEVVGKNYMPARTCRKVLSHEYTTTSYVEEANFYVLHGAAGRAKEFGGISGDNYSFQELNNGQTVMSLSDGMGYGPTACMESETVIELLEQLLDSGFREDAALKMINSVMLMNSGEEHPATLDFGVIDLHSGICDLVKIGAAATFVKRGNWIETIKSTSMPLGVFGEVDCDTTRKKLYDGDMVIMVSDGVLDALDCEDKAGKLSEIIREIQCENPKEMADLILNKALETGQENGGAGGKMARTDDMTVLVTGIWDKKSA
jgi:stage II sporulation protein E